jgi:ribosomal-protein-alanine N-acetyltransferase
VFQVSEGMSIESQIAWYKQSDLQLGQAREDCMASVSGRAPKMIETKRLILRKMTMEDLDDLLLIFTDPKVMASFGEILFDRENMRQWVQRNLDHQERYGYGLFSVILKESGDLVGDCGLEHLEVDGSPEVEIGYDFLSSYWNRGLATEAASAVRDFAFEQLGLQRVVSLIRPDNLASIRVAEKIGMKREKEGREGDIRYYVYSQSRDRTAARRKSKA